MESKFSAKSHFLNVFGGNFDHGVTWGKINRQSKLPHLWGNFDPLLLVVFLAFGMRLVCEMM